MLFSKAHVAHRPVVFHVIMLRHGTVCRVMSKSLFVGGAHPSNPYYGRYLQVHDPAQTEAGATVHHDDRHDILWQLMDDRC